MAISFPPIFLLLSYLFRPRLMVVLVHMTLAIITKDDSAGETLASPPTCSQPMEKSLKKFPSLFTLGLLGLKNAAFVQNCLTQSRTVKKG